MDKQFVPTTEEAARGRFRVTVSNKRARTLWTKFGPGIKIAWRKQLAAGPSPRAQDETLCSCGDRRQSRCVVVAKHLPRLPKSLAAVAIRPALIVPELTLALQQPPAAELCRPNGYPLVFCI
jgi:hypothetical protein